MDEEKIVYLYVNEGMSIRGICLKLNIGNVKRAEISRLLKARGHKVRNGKGGDKIGDKVLFYCPECKKPRVRILRKHGEKTRKCQSCANAESHKNNPRIRRHEGHYNWKGGIHLNGQGYIVEYITPKNPYYLMASNPSGKRHGGYVLQHRLVMASHLGRCLQPNEIVHHKTGDKQNNSIENLAVYTRSQHKNTYQDGYRAGYRQASVDLEHNLTWDGEKWVK